MKSQETLFTTEISTTLSKTSFTAEYRKKDQLSNKKWIIQKRNKPFLKG